MAATATGEGQNVLVVFDLDYTVWPFYADTHVYPPMRRDTRGFVVDSLGNVLRLFPDIVEILRSLQVRGIPIAAISRTERPDIADSLLGLFGLRQYFVEVVFDRGTKQRGIRAVTARLNLETSDAILFDDEHGNIADAKQIGTAAVLVPESGLSKAVFERALQKFLLKRKNGL